jgi:hypothetical protein
MSGPPTKRLKQTEINFGSPNSLQTRHADGDAVDKAVIDGAAAAGTTAINANADDATVPCGKNAHYCILKRPCVARNTL